MLMLPPCCLCGCEYPPHPHLLLNAWTNLYETWDLYHDTWVPLISMLHKSLPSACVSFLHVQCIPPVVDWQRPVKSPTSTNTAVELLDACLWVCVSPTSLLGNNSVKTFLQQRRIVGGVLYAVRVRSNESRQLVLSRTSCFQRTTIEILCRLQESLHFSLGYPWN
jgi:hypothetical protein